MQYDSISCNIDCKTSGDLAKTTASSTYNNKISRMSSLVNILSKPTLEHFQVKVQNYGIAYQWILETAHQSIGLNAN